MKKKQFLAVLLAATCAVSMAVPTFAEDTNPELATAENEADQDIEGLKDWIMTVGTEVQKPTLKVTLPKSTSVLVNPYRIEIDTENGSSFDTILSPEMDIINNSGCAIKVGVKGMIQTYSVYAGKEDALKDAKDAFDLTDDCTLTDVAIDDIKTPDNKVFYDADGKQLTVTIKAPVYEADKVTVKTKGTLKLTGYTASKIIKVATAPMKDVDADKSNTLFIYVEGKADGGDWATTFDSKAIAGVKDTKTGVMSTTGMMALAAKENTVNILYLGSKETGKVRVTGQASTAPTQAWMNLADTFETPFTFVIDAVANQAPAAPELKTLSFANGPSVTLEAGKTAYTGLTWDESATANSTGITFTTDPAGATMAVSSSDNSIIKWDDATSKLKIQDNGTATVTLVFTNKGVSSSYTFEITTSNH